MRGRGTFSDGFIAGWRSIMGPGAPIPGVPPHSIPAWTTAYLHGITKGIEAAQKRKTEMEGKKSN